MRYSSKLCNPISPAPWNRPPVLDPKPRYEKNDTSAASARMAELRRREVTGFGLPVPREFLTP